MLVGACRPPSLNKQTIKLFRSNIHLPDRLNFLIFWTFEQLNILNISNIWTFWIFWTCFHLAGPPGSSLVSTSDKVFAPGILVCVIARHGKTTRSWGTFCTLSALKVLKRKTEVDLRSLLEPLDKEVSAKKCLNYALPAFALPNAFTSSKFRFVGKLIWTITYLPGVGGPEK